VGVSEFAIKHMEELLAEKDIWRSSHLLLNEQGTVCLQLLRESKQGDPHVWLISIELHIEWKVLQTLTPNSTCVVLKGTGSSEASVTLYLIIGNETQLLHKKIVGTLGKDHACLWEDKLSWASRLQELKVLRFGGNIRVNTSKAEKSDT